MNEPASPPKDTGARAVTALSSDARSFSWVPVHCRNSPFFWPMTNPSPALSLRAMMAVAGLSSITVVQFVPSHCWTVPSASATAKRS